jgi:adenosylcobinamide-phosphate synthase
VAALAVAFTIDVLFGDPPNRWHPVAWLGSAIAMARRRFAHGSTGWLLVSGALVTIAISGLAGLTGIVIAQVAAEFRGVGLALEAVALSCCLSVRGLWRAAAHVAARLDAGDIAGARAALAWHLVSRPTADLDEGEIAAGAVESVAENLTDSVVAPALMYLVFGLPGAMVYRTVNTADAMLGYREGALEHFGKLAARTDDLLNLIPARVAALAIVAAAPLVGAAPARAFTILWRDRARTASPNAGWTMAAMAGALGVRLVKRDAYVLGDGPLPGADDIRRSLRVMIVAATIALSAAAAMVATTSTK